MASSKCCGGRLQSILIYHHHMVVSGQFEPEHGMVVSLAGRSSQRSDGSPNRTLGFQQKRTSAYGGRDSVAQATCAARGVATGHGALLSLGRLA